MDPLDIMTNIDNIMPFFQAIFSADEQRVIGYEILGRIQLEEGIQSLGPFFQDESIPEDYRIEVDNLILTKALDAFLEQKEPSLIFFNRDTNILMLDRGESLLELLLGYRDKGLAMDRLVMEITEHNYKGNIDELCHLVTYFQTYGIKIAIDNIGKESSNLDRIGLLSPDIYKIDLAALRQTSTDQSFHDVLSSIILLATKAGANLLYEDIEMNFQLQYAWINGGRYYQGFYLHEPSMNFVSENILKERLKQEIQHFIKLEKSKLENLLHTSLQFHQRVQQLVSKYKKIVDYNQLIMQLAHELSDCSFRIYICDEDGFQKTGNVFKNPNGWVMQLEYYEKNWSWRPYFLKNIITMRYDKKGLLSDLYSDIETGETIRTFSYPINDTDYLFIDLTYNFLFENDELL